MEDQKLPPVQLVRWEASERAAAAAEARLWVLWFFDILITSESSTT
jgi:hypothetical protein